VVLLNADQTAGCASISMLRIEIQFNCSDAAIVDLNQWFDNRMVVL